MVSTNSPEGKGSSNGFLAVLWEIVKQLIASAAAGLVVSLTAVLYSETLIAALSRFERQHFADEWVIVIVVVLMYAGICTALHKRRHFALLLLTLCILTFIAFAPFEKEGSAPFWYRFGTYCFGMLQLAGLLTLLLAKTWKEVIAATRH